MAQKTKQYHHPNNNRPRVEKGENEIAEVRIFFNLLRGKLKFERIQHLREERITRNRRCLVERHLLRLNSLFTRIFGLIFHPRVS